MKRVHVSTHLLFFTEKGYFFLHLIEVVRILILIDGLGWKSTNWRDTGKSLSEALIFASTNPQHDDMLIIELQVQYVRISSSEHGENMLCKEIQNNLCTQHVLPMFCKNKSFWQRFTCTENLLRNDVNLFLK